MRGREGGREGEREEGGRGKGGRVGGVRREEGGCDRKGGREGERERGEREGKWGKKEGK